METYLARVGNYEAAIDLQKSTYDVRSPSPRRGSQVRQTVSGQYKEQDARAEIVSLHKQVAQQREQVSPLLSCAFW